MFVNRETEAPDHEMSFFPVLRQIRTSQEPSLKPLPFTSVQINTDRHSTVAAGELEGKESPRLQSSSRTKPFLATKGRTGKTNPCSGFCS